MKFQFGVTELKNWNRNRTLVDENSKDHQFQLGSVYRNPVQFWRTLLLYDNSSLYECVFVD